LLIKKENIMISAGKKFRKALKENSPLQILGVINAYSAIQAERVGAKALYLSGAGVANASYGLPDLGMTMLEDVCIDIRRITGRCDLPLLVDADTGWGGAFNIARTVKEMTKAGAAGCHIEDQVAQKRCGHRPNKELVSIEEMSDRICAAVDAKTDLDFVIMARTDAHASEGQDAALKRAHAYVEAGADMIFAEAIHTLKEYEDFTNEIKVPVLANITEFGATPMFTVNELASVGISMVLYPLSGFRAMNKAALNVFEAILKEGTQSSTLDIMQTRMELYDMLDYHSYEDKLDALFSKDKI
jgi:methylisocitrate lyase